MWLHPLQQTDLLFQDVVPTPKRLTFDTIFMIYLQTSRISVQLPVACTSTKRAPKLAVFTVSVQEGIQ